MLSKRNQKVLVYSTVLWKFLYNHPKKKKLSPDLWFYKKYIAIARDYLKQMPLFHANTSNLTFSYQCFPHIETSQLICFANQLTCFCMGGHRYEKSWKCVREVCNLQNYNTYNLTVIWKLSKLCNANKNVIKYQKQIQ